MSTEKDFVVRSSPSLNGADQAVFKALRKESELSLASLTLPSTKDEYWKYTRLNKLGKKNFSTEETKTAHPQKEAFTERVITIDEGHFSHGLNEEKLKVFPIEQLGQFPDLVPHFGKQQRHNEHYFDALNTRSFNHGFVIWVAQGFDARELEIQEHFNTESKAYQHRYLIVLEKQAKLSLNHRIISNSKDQFINALMETVVSESAQMKLNLIQELSEESSLIETVYCEQKDNSDYRIFTASLDGELIRNNLNINVIGEHCETHLNGLSLGRAQEHIDHHTVVDHKLPNCESHENYKGIFYDKSTGVFNGKVFVRQDAQKINAFQSNQNIVMSDDAKVYSKPELEIYADDVKCSHGSTTGQFDEEAIFYLQSRGIGIQKARSLMVHAFLAELTEKLDNEAMRSYLEERIEDKLSKSI